LERPYFPDEISDESGGLQQSKRLRKAAQVVGVCRRLDKREGPAAPPSLFQQRKKKLVVVCAGVAGIDDRGAEAQRLGVFEWDGVFEVFSMNALNLPLSAALRDYFEWDAMIRMYSVSEVRLWWFV